MLSTPSNVSPVRRSSTTGATQAQPRDVCLVVHYGPYHEYVAEHHSLFSVAAALLARVTPWLRYVEPVPADGVMRVPDVEIPRDVLQSFFSDEEDDNDTGDEDDNKGSVRKLSRPALPGSTEDSLATVNRRGRPVLSLRSAALGEIVVASWTQWESVQELLLQEERNKYRTHYYQPTQGQPPNSHLLVHAELTILWFEVDVLHCLHYADLVQAYMRELSPDQPSTTFEEEEEYEEEETGEDPDDEGESDADREVDIPLEGAIPVREADKVGGELTGHTRAYYDDPHDTEEALLNKAAAAAVRASLTAPSLIARLYVVDADGSHRGQVLLPVALDPPVGLAELEQLVRAASNFRRHRAVRISYRVLPPSSLVLSPSRTPSRPGSAQVAGLAGLSSGPAPSTPRELGVSLTSTTSHYSQQPGVLARSVLKPLDTEADVSGLIDDVLLYGYRAIRLVVVETDAPARPAIAEAAPRLLPRRYSTPLATADKASVSAGGSPSARDRADAGCQSGGGPAAAAQTSHEHDKKAKYEDDNDVDVSDDDDDSEEDEEDALVVVRYTVDPVEVHVTGEVSETQLMWLADAIYSRCCRPDNYQPASAGEKNGDAMSAIVNGTSAINQRMQMRPRFMRVLDARNSAASVGSSTLAEAPAAPMSEPPHWVLPLHRYQFSEADEEVMGLCIQEAMINSGDMTAIAPEEIEDLVHDLEREHDAAQW